VTEDAEHTAEQRVEHTQDARGTLAACRTEIEALDRQLVALVAERFALARRTAGLKRELGLPILDPEREALVIRRAVAAAREHGLDTEPVRQIFWHIVGMSRRGQEARP
jgi:chorismate mutase